MNVLSQMNLDPFIEPLALYLPLSVAAILWLSLNIYPRLRVAIVMTTLWQAATLPWVNFLASSQNWWQFTTTGPSIFGIPTSFYLGWIVLWGIISTICLGKLPTRYSFLIVLLIFGLLDLFCMPLLNPVLELSPQWLIGELFLLILCLTPSLWLAHLTLLRRGLPQRSSLICFAFCLFVIGVLPFCTSPNITQELALQPQRYSHLAHALWLGAFFTTAIPGVSAAIEFVRIGHGTPIPFDPPQKLTTSGAYAYLKNPMQTSMAASLIVWGLYWNSPLCYILALVSCIYSVGIAHWSENDDLEKRFGSRWSNYKKSVRSWIPRWRPYPQNSPARIYFDLECDSCSMIARWFQRRIENDLQLHPSNSHPSGKLKRVSYEFTGKDECASGVIAIGCALQHIHFGWAFVGWIIQLPLISHIAQVSMDSVIPPKP